MAADCFTAPGQTHFVSSYSCWMSYYKIPLTKLHMKEHQRAGKVQHSQVYAHTSAHTPGHWLFSLIWYQSEDLSKHLMRQLISHIAPGNDYCHKFPPTAHIVIWNILRVVVTLCGVCFVFTSLFWLIWLFSFIGILLFCHLRAAEVLHMCK